MRRTIEIQTTGFDEFLQGIGGDPEGGGTYIGLRVPSFVPADRYLFQGFSFSIGAGVKARVLGHRKLITIGVKQGTGDTARFVEQEVTSPVWRFQNGNVSFHLNRLGAPDAASIPNFGQGPIDSPSFKFQWAHTPALLYATAAGASPFYTSLTAYTAPNGGKPWGSSVYNGVTAGAQYGLDTPWRTHGAWHALGFDIIGPDTISGFISVKQSDPSTRIELTPPQTVYQAGIPPEEAFLLNFATAQYWRVGYAIILETDTADGILVHV